MPYRAKSSKSSNVAGRSSLGSWCAVGNTILNDVPTVMGEVPQDTQFAIGRLRSPLRVLGQIATTS